jgi:hypothetical protein
LTIVILPEKARRGGGESRGPFRQAARTYRDLGWLGTLPLPSKAKEPPPDGFTGHGAPYPDNVDVRRWRKDCADGNICLRLAEVPCERLNGHLPFAYSANNVDGWELIGIDVDDYGDKHGAAQLAALEAELGPLPETVVSSARWVASPLSGTRLFLVPKGFKFKGKAVPTGHTGPKHIDVLYAGLRYLVVWPSIHPTGAEYEHRYGRPGSASALKVYDGVPPVEDVAVLPEKWFGHLKTGESDGADLKSDITFSELQEWAEATFRDCGGDPCAAMADKLAEYIGQLDGSDSHHPLTDAVWFFTKSALEGHAGYNTALMRYLNHWWDVSKDKRSDPDIMRGEIARSIDGALAKAKAEHDNERNGYMPDDKCAGGAGDVDVWVRKMLEAIEAEPVSVVPRHRPRRPARPRRPMGGGA